MADRKESAAGADEGARAWFAATEIAGYTVPAARSVMGTFWTEASAMGRATRLHRAVPPRHAARARAVETTIPTPAATPAPAPLIRLQQSIGNRAVGRLVHAKLRVGRPGDRFEREADRVADQVLATPAHAGLGAVSARIQRLGGGPTGPAGTAPASVDRVLASPGRPLEPALQQDMQRRFGHDFAKVRVHSGALAERSARDVAARAYTVGDEIVFGTGALAPRSPEGRRLLAHELTHVVQQSGADGISAGQHRAPSLQRQEAPSAEIEMPAQYAFALDPSKRADKRYARSLGQKDAAWIRKSGKLPSEVHAELTAKRRFFEQEAWEVYLEQVRPAVVEVTQEPIEMPAEGARPSQPADQLAKFTSQATYIDNNMKKISFFTAELAIIYYNDGSSFELGLVPRWMKPPVVEVDYHTPREDYRLRHDPKEGLSFIREGDLRDAPRNMPWGEVQKRYAQPLEFFVQRGTGRVVPSRVNMLTAPNLCRELRGLEKEFLAQTRWVAEWGREVATVIPTPGGFVGRAGKPDVAKVTKHTGRMASRQGASRAVKQLTEQLDDLLKVAGIKDITVAGVRFERVQLSKQGSRLAVRRFKIQRVNAPPGHGGLVSEAFEDAAASVARMNGLKTVTIDVGIITNPGWREWLEGLGYVYTQAEGGWIKTITL